MSNDTTIWIHPCLFLSSVEDSSLRNGLIDYKFYCFNGEPRFLYVSQGLENHETAHISFLSLDWKFLPFRRGDYAPFGRLPNRPVHFDDMVKHARALADETSFVRVDFYEHNGRDVFSEMTFHPCSGFMPVDPAEGDLYMGDFLRLRSSDSWVV